jgi:hypothetical protein
MFLTILILGSLQNLSGGHRLTKKTIFTFCPIIYIMLTFVFLLKATDKISVYQIVILKYPLPVLY